MNSDIYLKHIAEELKSIRKELETMNRVIKSNKSNNDIKMGKPMREDDDGK